MAKTLAIVFGIIFVILSLLAFISNPLIGTAGSNAVFTADATYDILYLLLGIILLIAAGAGTGPSALWLKVIGIVELILFLDGLLQPSMLFGFIGAASADAWLNLVLGVLLLIAGYWKGKQNAPGM